MEKWFSGESGKALTGIISAAIAYFASRFQYTAELKKISETNRASLDQIYTQEIRELIDDQKEKINNLETKMNTVLEQLGEKNKAINQLERENSSLSEKVAKLESQVDKLKAKLDKKDELVLELRKEISRLTNENNQLQNSKGGV